MGDRISPEFLQGVHADLQQGPLADPMARLGQTRGNFFEMITLYAQLPTMRRREWARGGSVTYAERMSDLIGRILLEPLKPEDRAMHLAACLAEDETQRTRFSAELNGTPESRPPSDLSLFHHDLTKRIASDGEGAHEELAVSFAQVLRSYFLHLELHINNQPRAAVLAIGRQLLRGAAVKRDSVRSWLSPGLWPIEQ